MERYAGARDHDALKAFAARLKEKVDPNADRTDEKIPDSVEEPPAQEQQAEVSDGPMVAASLKRLMGC